jgi:hypothetical protein
LLEGEGFIEIEMRSAAGAYWVKGLTPLGHDYLGSIRDPDIFQKAKIGAASAGGEPPKDWLISDEKHPELFTLKPSVWGMGMDLKELFRRAKAWWTRQK